MTDETSQPTTPGDNTGAIADPVTETRLPAPARGRFTTKVPAAMSPTRWFSGDAKMATAPTRYVPGRMSTTRTRFRTVAVRNVTGVPSRRTTVMPKTRLPTV